MASATRHQRTLRATLCEVERGVFYTTYPDCESVFEAAELTNYQVGTSAADARQRVEQCARALGYDAVTWTETIVVPLFASSAKSTAGEAAAAFVSPVRALNSSRWFGEWLKA